jgi:SAM-dependent methyltransferase
MRGRDHWMSIAASSETEELKEHILTGSRSGKPFAPYVPTIALPSPVDRVLDFGCGVGRNFPYLKQIARQVTGFDLPPMIERCRALAAVPAERLADDWDALRSERFDLVFCALVLQHIEPAACRAFLADFARMSPHIYLLSRATSDFPANVFDLVADTARYDAPEVIEVDHDPGTHQLRVLGRHPFDAARRTTEGRHFEVLLRTRGETENEGP